MERAGTSQAGLPMLLDGFAAAPHSSTGPLGSASAYASAAASLQAATTSWEGEHAALTPPRHPHYISYHATPLSTATADPLPLVTPVRHNISTIPQSVPERGRPSPRQQVLPRTGPSPHNKKAELYKTELCLSFEETHACRYGDRCQFAHGVEELRPTPRHRKFKSELCKTVRPDFSSPLRLHLTFLQFINEGSCPYGRR